MKKTKTNQKGITLIALIITIIVLLIIAGITVYSGKDSIRKANLEGLKTNMLLIQTKAKEYIENASFQLGVNPGDDKWTKAETYLQGEDKGTKVESGGDMATTLINIGIKSEDIQTGKVYQLSTSNLEKMGINNVQSDSENGYNIIVYDLDNTTAEIYNTIGYDNKYSLTDIERIEI